MRSRLLCLLPRLALLAALLAPLSGCRPGDDVRALKLGHSLPVTHPVHQAMVFMDARLQAVSGGQMRLEIYSDGQLGSERVLLELLQIGSLGMTKVSASVMASFAPEYAVLELPYLWRDDAHRFGVLDGPVGARILQGGTDYWLRGLAFYDAGSRSFYSCEEPIRTPADLAGTKVRVMNSKNAIAMVEALGAAATPIAYGELYTALQQGVVDAAENNPPSFFTSHHYEVCPYYTLDEHTSVPDVLVVSTKVWDTLTAQEQQWLQEAAHASAARQIELWAEAERESLAAVEAAGVEIIRPDKAPFAAQVAPVIESFRDRPALYDLIQQIQAAP